MHESFISDDQQLLKEGDKYLTGVNISKYAYVDQNSYLNFINDSLTGNVKYKLSDFMALLMGLKVDSSGAYKQEVYQPKTQSLIYTTHNSRGAPPKASPTDSQEAKNSLDMLTNLNKKILINFSELATIDFATEYLIGKTGDILSKDQLLSFDQSTYNKVLENIKTKTDILGGAATASQNQNEGTITYNALKIFDDFYRDVSTITEKNLDGFYQFLKLVTKHFKIKAVVGGFNGAKQNLTFYAYNKPNSTKISKTKEIKSIENKLIIADYGGLVVNFHHLVKSLPLSFGSTSSGNKKIVNMTVAGVTLELEMDKTEIDDYSKEVYRDTKNTNQTIVEHGNAYYETVKSAIEKDPDGFLLRFIEFAAANKGKLKPPEPLASGLTKKGGQHLTLNLRHPVPNIGVGSVIYFMGAGEELLSPISETTQVDKDPIRGGYYVVPPKVRGVYYVTKVHHVLSNKENIWTQRLECER
jgi:hypothetical protein